MTAPGQVTSPPNTQRTPPYKLAGAVLLVVVLVVATLVYIQFRGGFADNTKLTLVSSRAGLVMDPGSKVTYNGVEIGRVAKVAPLDSDGTTKAQLTLDVDPRYIDLIPANVNANIQATTVFGNKYVSFTSPDDPVAARISSADVIDVSNVTTEFNTLFETITSISEQVDPVKLNLTLSATAEALTGLGDKFGESLVRGNSILDDINPRMPQIRYDVQRLADLGEVYTSAAPDLFDALDNAVITARTLNERQGDLDAALLAAVGFGNTGADVFERGGPFLVRGAADLVTTSRTLDEYSPAIFCTIRNYATVAPKVAASLGGNGYSLNTNTTFLGAENPYVYPDNLPRVNAKGGPGGAPGCWQEITRELWPAPYLVMDTGASIAPYNHFELGQPILTEYVWGRQVGENTINP
ncbi:virulence factor Mce family protein [Mycolicibacterium murale]|uniref:Virulence factor Mce family protein n=1 Tax=Mycolicibacterium murale TaxID=182220 RepID=A0A7I9WHM8_9MYCO|nr:MCE family protein [Mycolicibacterium murale]MCV7180836.1 MCE family protein [Mycolicibacterium murale]GFG57059.1 virulence factor Mce family protein [Mycolicibacterium murale]